MIDQIFLQLLNMSFTASIVIIIVLVVRLCLRKIPKIFSYALWSVVLFRLLCPLSFESFYSLLPTKAEPISQDIVYMQEPKIDSGITGIDQTVNSLLPAGTLYGSINPIQVLIAVGSRLWLIGIAAMIICNVIALMKFKKRLRDAKHDQDNIFLSEAIQTAFVIGFLHPVIYLPPNLRTTERNFILLHEQIHIKRLDHLVKLIGFFALCIHWFNPLVWAAFFISSKDAEMACDEAVIRQLGNSIKQEYSSSLLNLAVGGHIIGGTPLAFGEGDTKNRIKHILNYKKPAFWLVCISFAVIFAVIIGLLANPKRHPIVLPESGEVSGISIKQIIKGEDRIKRKISEPEAIRSILNALKNTEKTKKSTINDVPDADNYFQIELAGTDLRTFFLFQDNQQYYIEEPYLGIYKISRESTLSIINTEDVSIEGVLPENHVTALWKARAKYIGDNSAVGKLIGLLPYPEGVQYQHFELQTKEPPYSIEIVYSVSTDTLKTYNKDGEPMPEPFQKNALILLALVDNVDMIKATLTDGGQKIQYVNVREWANTAVDGDIRTYAESLEKLGELVRKMNNGEIEF